ncbi:MAG: hypothetical protein KKB30_07720 [Proteobacteria bacterium]|nr:hypothetical protein [Pseudomonadota bacterium]MBU1714933.1 hypothetical protein [Pseudomonadota bacterium]
MLTVTIKISERGTSLNNGDTSRVGHMWYSLDDGNGNTISYGFSPRVGATGISQAFGPGQVNAHGQDDDFYLSSESSVTIDITQAQYDAMKNFGDNPTSAGFSEFYNGASNSCIDFTWKALEEGGLNPLSIDGLVWPTWNKLLLDEDFIEAQENLNNAIEDTKLAINSLSSTISSVIDTPQSTLSTTTTALNGALDQFGSSVNDRLDKMTSEFGSSERELQKALSEYAGSIGKAGLQHSQATTQSLIREACQ